MIAQLTRIYVVIFLFFVLVGVVMDCEVSKIVSVPFNRHNLCVILVNFLINLLVWVKVIIDLILGRTTFIVNF